MPKTNGSLKRDAQYDEEESANKKLKKSNESFQDIHRTGAKCLPSSKVQDPKEKGML